MALTLTCWVWKRVLPYIQIPLVSLSFILLYARMFILINTGQVRNVPVFLGKENFQRHWTLMYIRPPWSSIIINSRR